MLSALSRMIQQNWLGMTILFAVVAAFVLLRSPATRLASGQELDALLADGTPKVVEAQIGIPNRAKITSVVRSLAH